MQKSGRIKYRLLLTLCFLSIVGICEAQKLWSQVRLNRSATYVNQPVEVTITVYTSTWFTSGLDPGNIKVNGAFTTYFRPVSTSFMEGSQNYAGIQLIYHVFPFDEKDVIFPSLTLEVETPPDGDYIGVKRKLKTKERLIKVRSIPPGFSKSDWLVANGLSVKDRWSKVNRKVMVGDVLERRVTRTAYGTVAELVPPVSWDSIATVSMYPSRSTVDNFKGKTAISSSRTESMRYLFEKEGEVTFPEMVFTWYHPYQKKLYKKTLKAVTFEVSPNPNLGILSSVKDSLAVRNKEENIIAKKDEPFNILGMSWSDLVKWISVAILSFYILFVFLKSVINYLRSRRKAYLVSEAYYFDQFKKAVRQKNKSNMIKTAYRWFDELGFKRGGLIDWVSIYGSEKLKNEVLRIEHKTVVFKIHEWKLARKNYFSLTKDVLVKDGSSWINP